MVHRGTLGGDSAGTGAGNTQEWKEQYAHRAGVEDTISQGVRAFGLRRCRYYGLAKARLQHQLAATAMNFHRCQRPVD
ncbi:transposase [Streptomyces sp. NRRL F-5135]|uniref:transposase n=1 Tax=Streptomyces sp. NRRL F-5135 TaxID=1463858 RepID=UPI00131D3712